MTEVGEFTGRFHPLLVHFPIAFLLLAGLLEAIAARHARRPGRSRGWAEAAVAPLLVLGAASAAAAAGAGYLLGRHGGYAGPTFDNHVSFGFAVAGAAALSAAVAVLRARYGGRWSIAARLLLTVTLVLLTVAGHLGATLTHGEGFLTEHAPPALRRLLRIDTAGSASPPPSPGDQALVYADIVRPVLDRRCAGCHGPDRIEGGLRLDTPEHIAKGGDDGPILTPGRAATSELVRRVWLPAGHEDVMPPRGASAIAPAEASLLRWWVDAGAPFDGPLASLELPPDLIPAAEALVGPLAGGGPTLPSAALAALDRDALAAMRTRGLAIDRVATDSLFLQVRCCAPSDVPDDERVAALQTVAPHVLWLALPGSTITDVAYDTIARMSHLTRLDVSRTITTDAALAKLAPLQHLEYLNLYATGVTDAGLASLAALPKLRRLYVWQTAVTAAGAERLKTALPRLDVVLGEGALGDGADTPPVQEGAAPAGTRPVIER